MSTGPTNLYDLKAQCLNAVVSYFAEMNVTLPAVQYVSSGVQPTGASDELVVTARIDPGTPTRSQAQQAVKHLIAFDVAQLTIWLIRSIQVVGGEGYEITAGVMNPAAMESANAQLIDTDMYLVRKALRIAQATGQLGVDSGSPIGLGPTQPLNSSGGMGGCRTDFSFELI
jgi:hypothetical protein